MLLLEEIKCWATKVPCSWLCFFPFLECIQAHPKIKSLPGERETIGLHSGTTEERSPNKREALPPFQTDILSPTFPLILFSWSFRIAE